MNKERFSQIIDEVYQKYTTKYMGHEDIPSKDLFLFEIKKNKEFSERWGLKTEEQELSLVERREIAKDKLGQMEWADVIKLAHYKETYDKYNIPKKLITLTYNNEILESYE
jgi:hypothetical protein